MAFGCHMLTRRPSASTKIRRPSAAGTPRPSCGPLASDFEISERRDVDLDVEMADVADDRAVLHHFECSRATTACRPSRCRDVADLRGVGHRHDLEAVHQRLERAHRVDLGHDHVRPRPLARIATPARPSRSRPRRTLAGQQHVRGPDNPVDRALARAVAVVEEVLRPRVVDAITGNATRRPPPSP